MGYVASIATEETARASGAAAAAAASIAVATAASVLIAHRLLRERLVRRILIDIAHWEKDDRLSQPAAMTLLRFGQSRGMPLGEDETPVDYARRVWRVEAFPPPVADDE